MKFFRKKQKYILILKNALEIKKILKVQNKILIF